MHRFRVLSLSLGLIVCSVSVACVEAALADRVEPRATDDCQPGTFRFSDGEIVDIARSEGDTFRWRKFDGATGVLRRKEDGSWTSRL